MPTVRTLIEWTDAAGATGALEIDVVKTRTWELTAEVTEFPVESGTNVSDHIRPQNGTITLEGTISNTPLVVPTTQMQGITRGAVVVQLRGGDGAVKASVLKFSGAFDRVKVCDQLLEGLVASGTPVKLTTPLRIVRDLAIKRYSVPQDSETGQSLPITLELRKLRIVSTGTAAVPAVRRLRVTSTRAVQPPDDRSAAARLLDGGAPPDAARQRARAAMARRGGGVGL